MRVVRIKKSKLQLNRVFELNKLCFPSEPIVVSRAAKATSYWWLVMDGKTPVAFAGLEVRENVGFLCRVGVIPSHRGQGLQRVLIRARERLAKGLNLNILVTYTAKDNLISSNNLIKTGFLLYIPSYRFGVKGAMYWSKSI